MATQVKNGKAFEYALLDELHQYLKPFTTVFITEDSSFQIAKNFFNSLAVKDQEVLRMTSNSAISFLFDIEPRLSNIKNEKDVLLLEIASDHLGKSGDVRDVIIIRSKQNWEIGISAKHNHKAVKHSRLSLTIDFGEKWLGIPCSATYFNEISPIFNRLADLKKQDKSMKWDVIGDKHQEIYVPVLNAFKKELMRLQKVNPKLVAANLIQYLIGRNDFYKIIKGKKKVEIQGYNLHGTLSLPFEKIKPKAKIEKLKLPTRLIEIIFQDNSTTTLLVTMNEGWQISFRIHSASSRIEPSLKFDINLVSAPQNLFRNIQFVV